MLNIPKYECICLRTDQDLDKVESLVSLIIARRALLSSLKELVIVRPPGYVCFDPEDQVHNPGIAPDQNHVLQYIDSLNLPDDEKPILIRSLSKYTDLYTEESIALDINQQRARSLQQTQNAFAHAVAALVVTLAPNLEILNFQSFMCFSFVAKFMQLINYGELPASHLAKLRRIVITGKRSEGTSSSLISDPINLVGTLMCFHHLLSVESLVLNNVSDDIEESGQITVPHTSNIKSIEITNSELSSLAQAILIRVPKRNHLERFTYTSNANLDFDVIVYPKTIGKALETQKLALQYLELDADNTVRYLSPDLGDNEAHCDYAYEDDLLEHCYEDAYFAKDAKKNRHAIFPWNLPDKKPYGQTIGSLSGFSKLEVLRIGVKLLLGPCEAGPPPFTLIEALPVGLKEFTLLDYRHGENPFADALVKEFVEMGPSIFPFLTQVEGIFQEVKGSHQDQGALHDYNMMRDAMWDVNGWSVAGTK